MPLKTVDRCSNCGKKHSVQYRCECGKNQWCLACGFGVGASPCDCDGPVFHFSSVFGFNPQQLESLHALAAEWAVAHIHEHIHPETKDLEHWITEEVVKLFGYM